ncbi:spastin [Cajanus cajan]|uniref:spastin n=1 Tax=Cajanus cajan TaxID=3821 RepID=UPI00098D7B1A|nr:spastin [Cajanus cajan]
MGGGGVGGGEEFIVEVDSAIGRCCASGNGEKKRIKKLYDTIKELYVDSLLGARGGAFEHEATRRMRNEFMAAWDGLRSKENQRILILGATNRPFDLDDAVIRRLPRSEFLSADALYIYEKGQNKYNTKEKATAYDPLLLGVDKIMMKAVTLDDGFNLLTPKKIILGVKFFGDGERSICDILYICFLVFLLIQWFGDAEKLTKALFSFASKLAPVIIFVDEVDSLLGARGGAFEHEATRRMRNEFMAAWDGLRSKENQRILILGATNRPFDLDDAVIRRLPRR